jgi:hypothetical protein
MKENLTNEDYRAGKALRPGQGEIADPGGVPFF